jgi:prolipoprotein diacylglyceryltransferase
MYPDFQQLLESIFHADMPEWLSIFKTFGFLVALSFIGAAYTLGRELRRKESQGLLLPEFTTIEVGHPATPNELFWSALTGFIIGYKAGGFIGNTATITPDPMGYLFSLKGNFLIGIIGALILAYSKYAEKKKEQLPQPEQKRVAIYPHQRVGEFVMLAAIGGFVGAKVFNALETWDQFIANPAESLLSSSGFTFYGGLIVAAIAIYIYCRRHNISFSHMCDATAPGLMLAYGLGRLGCQFAGDGDWGIFNSAYITQPTGELVQTSLAGFQAAMQQSSLYFTANFGSLETVPHIYAPAPSWLPDWLFAMNYPHNVNNEGIALMGCTGNYCSVLPAGVFPTPMYEAVTCVTLFFVLWSLRKRLRYPWQMFGLYLILNGIERFFVEKIRVNYKYDWGFIHPTQAEIIAVCLAVAGIIIFAYSSRKRPLTETV